MVAWEELAPAEGEPEGLLVFHNGSYCSSLILRDFGLDFCERTRFRVVLMDLPGVGRSLVREGGISHLRDAAAQAASIPQNEGCVSGVYRLNCRHTTSCVKCRSVCVCGAG